MPDWVPNFLSSRALSLVVACVYLGITIYYAKPGGRIVTDLFLVGVALIFPLTCIWFGEEMGEFYGAAPGPAINRKSPGWMVALGGWLLLLLPAILYFFVIYLS